MNERIEKLAWQAMDEMDPESFSEDVHIPTEWYQKFAELIVRECVEVFSKDLPDPTSPDYQLGSLPEVVNRVANVAEHFGVEE